MNMIFSEGVGGRCFTNDKRVQN